MEPGMKFFQFIAFAAIAAAGLSVRAAQDPAVELKLPAEAAAAMGSIDAERIRAHVKFLADDLLEGRGTGTRGGDIAANYIAAQFALYGLKPAGDDGTYLQKVDFTGVLTQPGSSFSLLPSHGAPLDLKLGDDYVTNNQTQTESVDIDAPVVFVGYGIEAPEYRWNDFKGVTTAAGLTSTRRPRAKGRWGLSSSIAPIWPAIRGRSCEAPGATSRYT